MSTLEDLTAGREHLNKYYLFTDPHSIQSDVLTLLRIIEDHVAEQFEKRSLL